jgi:uncharacterized protein
MTAAGKIRKHMPQRTCVICRRVLPKRELTRIVSTPSSGVHIDKTGKMAGRGAYLCETLSCWEKAARSEVLSKALRTDLSDDERKLISVYGTSYMSQVKS